MMMVMMMSCVREVLVPAAEVLDFHLLSSSSSDTTAV